MIFIYLIVGLSILTISLGYYYYYYHNLNQALKNPLTRKLKVVPFKFNFILVCIFLAASISIAFVNDNNYKNQINASEEKRLKNIFEDMDFPDTVTAKVYTEYNVYFSGLYIRDSRRVLCLREDTPLELLDYLDQINYDYELKTYSYNELLQFAQFIDDSTDDSDGVVSLSIDMIESKVILYVSDEDALLSLLGKYVSDGILEIEFSEPFVTQ